MASANDVDVCADIERHLKAVLLLSGGDRDAAKSTPRKGNQNKKYEEDFPALSSGHTPSPHYSKNTRGPPGRQHAQPNVQNTPPHQGVYHTPHKPFDTRTPNSKPRNIRRDPREMNGYEYFRGKEGARVVEPVSLPRKGSLESSGSLRNSFSEEDSLGNRNLVKPLEAFIAGRHVDVKPVDNRDFSFQDKRITNEVGNVKQKKKGRRKEKKLQKDQAMVSILSKQAEEPVVEQEAILVELPEMEMEKKDMKKNIIRTEKNRRTIDEAAHQKLKNEIMREKQRFSDMERRNIKKDNLEIRLSHIDPKLLEILKCEYIYPLKKPSTNFPDALFLCQLCHYHCDRDNYHRHMNHANHITLMKIRRSEVFLQNLPYPTESQCAAVSKVLEELYINHGLTDEDLRLREEVANRLEKTLQENGLPEIKLQIYGSSFSGFGSKQSDLNLDLIIQSMETVPVVLCKLQNILRDQKDISGLSADFEAKMPKIFFKDDQTGLSCDISWSNIGTVQTSRLLFRYRAVDPRVPILGLAFKLWAQMCGVDRQEQGTLPAHCFPIMLIYFLQQHSPPVLPVLQEVKSDGDKCFTTTQSCLPLHDVDPSLNPENTLKEGKMPKKWKCRNTQTVGELWIELLRFYGVMFKATEHVVCIRFRKLLTRAEKKWDGKVIAIEDPYCRKRNLTRSIPNQVVYRFIQERLRAAYKYFGVPQLMSKGGPLYDTIEPEFLKQARKGREQISSPESSDFSGPEEEDIEMEGIHTGKGNDDKRRLFDDHDSSSSDDDILTDQDPDLNLEDVTASLRRLDLGESSEDCSKYRTESESSDMGIPLIDIGSEKLLEKVRAVTVKEKASPKSAEKFSKPRPESPPCQFIVDLLNSFEDCDLEYSFSKDILTNGKTPPLYCGMCGFEGHQKDVCPTQILPDLVDLPKLTPKYVKLLNDVCHQVMHEHAPSRNETEERDAILEELEHHIRLFYADANLELFGSSCNGFVFSGSDMDICLTFSDKKGENFDHAEVIDRLATHLRLCKRIHNIRPITTAKVPIVKFNHKIDNVECDISLYNTLAQHNTRMLRAYCKIDQRVQILGYTMKLFAKLCDIGDASRGSLSSYAYILMVLYFLQQRNPPVIPVLQELYDKNETAPEVVVDGWNAWFFDDVKDLSKIWPEYGRNRESVGELWIGLLRFYTEEFNFKEHVVCIRKKSLLTRFEKFWNAKIICIEDPFDLNHNLGVGVSRKMSIYIMKALIRGRELFGFPHDDNPRNYNLKRFLFDPVKLVVEAPPNDRGCRACGKIGHKVKECPNRKNMKRPAQYQQPQQQRMQNLTQQQQHQQQQQHHNLQEKQKMAARTEAQNRNEQGRRKGEMHGGPPPPTSQQAQYLKNILRYLPTNMAGTRDQPNHHQLQAQSMQMPKQNMQQHPQAHQGSPGQQKAVKNNWTMLDSFNDNHMGDGGHYRPSLLSGVHPLNPMSGPPPPPSTWKNSSPRPNVGFTSPTQIPLLVSPVDRTPGRENTNPPASSPVQTMSLPHPMGYFQGQGHYPLGYMTPPSLGTTPPSVHGLMYSQQPGMSPKQAGREEQQPMMNFRPPAPPPFPQSMWMVNGQPYASPPPSGLSPISPMRPGGMVGSQMAGSPHALLGTSPQQGNGVQSFAPQFHQLAALHPEHAVNNNRTLPD